MSYLAGSPDLSFFAFFSFKAAGFSSLLPCSPPWPTSPLFALPLSLPLSFQATSPKQNETKLFCAVLATDSIQISQSKALQCDLQAVLYSNPPDAPQSVSDTFLPSQNPLSLFHNILPLPNLLRYRIHQDRRWRKTDWRIEFGGIR